MNAISSMCSSVGSALITPFDRLAIRINRISSQCLREGAYVMTILGVGAGTGVGGAEIADLAGASNRASLGVAAVIALAITAGNMWRYGSLFGGCACHTPERIRVLLHEELENRSLGVEYRSRVANLLKRMGDPSSFALLGPEDMDPSPPV